MKISHIEHLGIAVKSIEEALPYYENVLGLKCYNIETVEDQKVRTAFLKVGDVKIELLEPTSPESTIAKFIEKNNGNGGMHHLAFAVEDGVANALAEAEVPNMMCFSYRFCPAVRYAKWIMDNGLLGDIVNIDVAYLKNSAFFEGRRLEWRFVKEKAGTGVLGDLGVHLIDLAELLAGDIKAVSGTTDIVVKQLYLPSVMSILNLKVLWLFMYLHEHVKSCLNWEQL